MIKLCSDLCVGLSDGHVYDMIDVYGTYEMMNEEMGKLIPLKYQSRRQNFYEVVQELIGPKDSYAKSMSKKSLLMYPGDQSKSLISTTLTKSIKHGKYSSESELTEDEDRNI